MSAKPRAGRGLFAALAAATIVVGLLVHRRGDVLGATARDVVGDALWGMMMAWWVGVLAPHRSRRWRALLAVSLCTAVEVSQLVRWPWLTALRRTTLGHLVLGSDFDARDLAAYMIGVLAAVLLEQRLRTEIAEGGEGTMHHRH